MDVGATANAARSSNCARTCAVPPWNSESGFLNCTWPVA